MHRPSAAGSVTSTSDRAIRRLTMVVVPVVAVALLAFGATAGASPIRVVVLAIVAGTFILTGLLAWARRPANRTGRVMVATGSFLMLDIFQGGTAPSLAPIGLIGSTVSDVLLGYLILSFPFGVLRSTADRVFLALAGAALLATNLLFFITFDPRAHGGNFDNPYRVIDDPAFASGAMGLSNLTTIVVLVGFLAMFAIRWARASRPARRTLSPVLLPSTALMFAIIIAIVVDGSDLPDDVKFVTGATQALVRALIPVGFLVGLLRTRMARSAIVDLVVELGETPAPARLRDALSNALGDPSLTVAYWAPDANAYVGADGARVEPRSEDAGRAVTFLERDGQPIAAILHDEMLLDDPGLVASVASAMRLSVENERLQAEVEAQLGEVRESRARIVAAGDAERRRVERDLHDGAQQRLVSLTLALRLARQRVGDDADPELRLSLEQASAEARSALSELRELARGIHPQILTEAGLGSAIQSLADRSSVDVVVQLGTDERFSPSVEASAYFVISEALANVAKYAGASLAHVRTTWQDDELTVEIADDGVGGAAAGFGGGLRGLADRLSAIGGRLEIVSPVGGGTRLVARIPTGAAAPASD
ncbi:MAG: histidine kinase [Candidatus Limnocylindrales bacterium]